MTTPTTHFKRYTSALLVGAGVGSLCLGVGGRLVMHVFALATARPGGFTLSGSLNVVFAGAIAGAVGGMLLPVMQRFMPKPRWLRGVLFSAICYLIAIPGLRPPRPLVFALFAPVFLAYGIVANLAWERLVLGRYLDGKESSTAATSG